MIRILISQFHNLYKKNGLSKEVIEEFQNIIYSYFKQHGRDFPFRKNINKYNVLISEIMLQQTQTSRVSEKYLNFKKQFPDFKTLADAPLDKVLEAWQGLGYNRRAIALKKIANLIIDEHDGKLPQDIEKLKSFPQIGHNTASSILAFAFDEPVYFIETNIRRVYIYFFFPGRNDVHDDEIMPLVKGTSDDENPRKWYYALMDYGVMLKKNHKNLHKRSAHYRKQKSFSGSNRQIRGKLLKLFLKEKILSESQIIKKMKKDPKRLKKILSDLEKEGFIKSKDKIYQVAK